MRGYLLLNLEPALDMASGSAALKAMAMAEVVVAITPFQSDDLMSVAQVLLPAGPFTETGGSFINTQGILQEFNGVVRAAGESRPAWKILRVLANRLDLKGFEFDSVSEVRDEALGGQAESFDAFLSNELGGELGSDAGVGEGSLERLADVPIYFSDALARRSSCLQETKDATSPRASVHPQTLETLAIAPGDQIVVSQDGGEATVQVLADVSVAPGVVRLAAAHTATANLSSMFGPVSVRRA